MKAPRTTLVLFCELLVATGATAVAPMMMRAGQMDGEPPARPAAAEAGAMGDMASAGTVMAEMPDMSINAADLERGAALYAQFCAVCHGAELGGQPDWRTPGPDGRLPPPPHDETGHTWHHGDRLLFDYVRLGGAEALAARGVSGFDSGMPAFGGILADAGIRDIMGFIKSTWPERIRAAQAEATASEGR